MKKSIHAVTAVNIRLQRVNRIQRAVIAVDRGPHSVFTSSTVTTSWKIDAGTYLPYLIHFFLSS